jgi:antitoxin ParD1/3/4
MRSAKPLTVTLGSQRDAIDERVRSGGYESASEVIRAALRALDREEQALASIMRVKIDEALADGRPGHPAEEVFSRLEAKYEKRLKNAL